MKFYENGEVTTKIEKIHVGYGINSQCVFAKRITTFSISKGIIIDRKYIPAKCFYRN